VLPPVWIACVGCAVATGVGVGADVGVGVGADVGVGVAGVFSSVGISFCHSLFKRYGFGKRHDFCIIRRGQIKRHCKYWSDDGGKEIECYEKMHYESFDSHKIHNKLLL
jgi:hypothetical protein